MTRGLEDVVEVVVDGLDATGIPYAISGALAMAYHGYPRATQDLDIQVRVTGPDALDQVHEHLAAVPRRIDALTWRFDERWEVEFYPVRVPLEEASLGQREEVRLFEDRDRRFWIVSLECLLVLKLREHLRYPEDLKHLDDIRKLIARNHERLDVEELDRLLALGEGWPKAWDDLVEQGW